MKKTKLHAAAVLLSLLLLAALLGGCAEKEEDRSLPAPAAAVPTERPADPEPPGEPDVPEPVGEAAESADAPQTADDENGAAETAAETAPDTELPAKPAAAETPEQSAALREAWENAAQEPVPVTEKLLADTVWLGEMTYNADTDAYAALPTGDTDVFLRLHADGSGELAGLEAAELPLRWEPDPESDGLARIAMQGEYAESGSAALTAETDASGRQLFRLELRLGVLHIRFWSAEAES